MLFPPSPLLSHTTSLKLVMSHNHTYRGPLSVSNTKPVSHVVSSPLLRHFSPSLFLIESLLLFSVTFHTLGLAFVPGGKYSPQSPTQMWVH